MIFYNKLKGKPLSKDQLIVELLHQKELVSGDQVVITKKLCTSEHEYYLIDSTMTAYKIDPNIYQVYEQ